MLLDVVDHLIMISFQFRISPPNWRYQHEPDVEGVFVRFVVAPAGRVEFPEEEQNQHLRRYVRPLEQNKVLHLRRLRRKIVIRPHIVPQVQVPDNCRENTSTIIHAMPEMRRWCEQFGDQQR